MCDLFALSAGTDYSAPQVLPIFAARAGRNMDGWGIGYFKKRHALVEKSAESVYVSGSVHDGFQRLARVVSSRIIIAHVRFRTSGPIDECHAHPFILHFDGQDWIFAHNGTAPVMEAYRSTGPQLDGAVSDSAKTFEYLRDKMVGLHGAVSGPASLFGALKRATAQMVEEYPGNYNYLLSNGVVLFAFTNHRQLMVLKGSRNLERGLLVTTLQRGLIEDTWLRIAKATGSLGQLLAIVGNDIVLNERVG